MRKSERKGEGGKRRRKIPIGPYSSSRIGRCVCVFGEDGLLLRALPNQEAASRWVEKHFGTGGKNPPLSELRCRSREQVNGVFDEQMRKGLISRREIADLLWYGGVASDWKGPQRNHNGQAVRSGHEKSQ